MRRQLTRMQSRLAALGLLLLLIAVLVAALAWPTWLLHKHYDNAIEESVDRLARYRRVAAMRPGIEQALSAVNAREARKYYWKGNTPALVAAEIQGTVTKIIESNNARIFSSQTLSSPDDGKTTGPAKATISVQITAAIVPLQLILHAIESNEPYLFIDQLSVRANQGRGYKATPGIQPEFVVQLTVRGYSHPGAPRT